MEQNNKVVDTKLIICKQCQRPQTVYSDGYFDDRNRRWKDAEGRTINGKMCGKCHQIKVRLTMRKLRENRKSGVESGKEKV